MKGYQIPSKNFVTKRGVSGSLEFEKRSEGSKLFKKLESEDILIFSKLDRVFRNTRNAFNMPQELKLMGVSAHFIGLGEDVTNDRIGSIIFMILSAFATFECEHIATHIREVQQIQKGESKFLGGFTHFGFTIEDEKLIPKPEEQLIIKEMKSVRRRDMSLRPISKWLDWTHGVTISHSMVYMFVWKLLKMNHRGVSR